MNGIFDDFRNAFRKADNGLMQIITINIIVFLVLLLLRVVFTLAKLSSIYVLVSNKMNLPASFYTFLFQPWSIITYFFTHVDVFHLLFNMLFLYWFGRLVHEYVGNKRLISLYVLGGIVGGIFYMLAFNFIPYFAAQQNTALMLGASGAAFAVVFGAATLLPDYTFMLLFIGPVRIKYIAFFYLILSIAQTTGSNAGGNLAHIGGAILGFVYIKQLKKGRDLGIPVSGFLDFIVSLFVEKPKPQIRVTHRSYTGSGINASSVYQDGEFPDEDEVDSLLDKISNSGYESLTKDEKLKLFKASQKK